MTGTLAKFPSYRPRRLRETPTLRRLVRETRLAPELLIAPLFVTEGNRKQPVASMPGVERLPVREAVKEAKTLAGLGLGGVLLFGIPDRKDSEASGAYAAGGVAQRTVAAIKKAAPDLPVITDVCLCGYASHGHCGVLKKGDSPRRGQPAPQDVPAVDNDATLPLLARVALSHARAGADLVAPSAMMDGQVAAIRRSLDDAGFAQVGILSYSAKFSSGLYGPFRDAAKSTPQFGDRRGYQMDPANAEEALREVALDIQEGADIVMVKPACVYLDVLHRIKQAFHWPTAVYQVSGEYALLKAAAARGWIDEDRLVLETATAMRRAGADLIITYYAKRIAETLLRRKE